jgi:protein gp37
MADTKIEWAETVWNPTTGCDRISPGCDRCYALTLAKRLKAMGQAKYQNDGNPVTSGPGFGLTLHPETLDVPLRWKEGHLVFVNSMSDIGHARVPRSYVAQVWASMAVTHRHTFQVLTKRPNRLAKMLAEPAFKRLVAREATDLMAGRAWQRWQLDLGGERLAGDSGLGGGWTVTPSPRGNLWQPPWPLRNVWLGTSIETDEYTDRADWIRQAPTALRFVSLEPLLEPLPSLSLDGIDWAIIGGESGRGARPLDLAAVRDLIGRCRDAGTAVFVKQLGSQWASTAGTRDKGANWEFWPDDLRIREFPREAATAA